MKIETRINDLIENVLYQWLYPMVISNLKVAFIQKGLMCLSFLQTYEPNYFPKLDFFFIPILQVEIC